MFQSTDDIKERDLPVDKKRSLRTGYTTGTCAAAATKAALSTLVNGEKLSRVNVSLPKDRQITIDIAWIKQENDKSVTAAVIKDGGDDPDVTNGAEVCSTVSILEPANKIVIDEGIGVGRVTKPGLGLEIGKAAINPTPLKMIYGAIEEILNQQQKKSYGLSVIISVPKGEEIAKKTDNPRLGILGGISILGTTGIVIPYSTASFAASIRQSLDVALAMGVDTVALTTGGRSEEFVKKFFNNTLPEHSLIQMGDFVGYAIKQCQVKKIKNVVIAGFIGKLTKIAMGVKQTHVKGSHVDLEFMAEIARDCTCSTEVVAKILNANTARHVQEIITGHRITGYFDELCRRAHSSLIKDDQSQLNLQIVMFDFDGKVCGLYPKEKHSQL